jgi:uncharacterized membrane protein
VSDEAGGEPDGAGEAEAPALAVAEAEAPEAAALATPAEVAAVTELAPHRLNLAVLFWLSLVPVLTEWVAAEYRHSLPAACYGVADLGAAIAYFVLVRTIVRANADSHVAAAIGSDAKGLLSAVLYAVAIGLAAVRPWLAYGVYVLVALIWLIPDRRLVR